MSSSLGQQVLLSPPLSTYHTHLNPSIPPILRVKSGETVSFDCLDASNGQITRSSTVSSISTLVFAQLDQVNGPIYVEGAAPGDTLQIDVISVETADWGWTGLIPGFGLLSDEFTEPSLRIWKIDKKAGVAMYDDKDSNTSTGIRIPIRPFAGEMGVAPGEAGAFSTIPPYATGGNIDTKHLSAGATLFLPVQVEGALFSIGDGHAAQGDGEVCGTAIETPMNVQVSPVQYFPPCLSDTLGVAGSPIHQKGPPIHPDPTFHHQHRQQCFTRELLLHYRCRARPPRSSSYSRASNDRLLDCTRTRLLFQRR